MSFIAPDWRDESNYPDPQETPSLLFWAWEFLRRNEGYQRAWGHYADRLQTMAQRLPQLHAYVERIVTGIFPEVQSDSEWMQEESLFSLAASQPEWFHFSPPALPGETMDEWAVRCSSQGAVFRDLRAFLGEKWGLHEIAHPARSYSMGPAKEVRFLNSGGALTWGGRSDKGLPKDGDPNHPFTGHLFSPRFDLRLPEAVLRAQFAQILAIRRKRIDASNFSPYRGRPEKSLPNFRNYLRTLDALAANVTLPAIAETILSHYSSPTDARKTVENWKKKAIKMRDVEYADLPAYVEINKNKKVKER